MCNSFLASRGYLSSYGLMHATQMLRLLRQLTDPVIIADLARAGVLRRLDLEGSVLVLPLLAHLLATQLKENQLAAMEEISQMLVNFGPLIRATRGVIHNAVGIDLNAEERQQRCKAFCEHMGKILISLQRIASLCGPTGAYAQRLQEDLHSIVEPS